MTDNNNGGRRQFLRCGLTAIAAMVAASPAKAQFPKSDQASAGYRDNAGQQTCAECSLFLPPDQCKVVEGPVSPGGTCMYFNA
jgi:hypothetical protein